MILYFMFSLQLFCSNSSICWHISGHCRRRKIRCIPAPGDLQNRCANCIRLKKECNFYPVDQGPPSELKNQRGTNGSRETGRISSSASPINQSGHSSEVRNGLPYPNLSMPPFLGPPEVKRSRTENFAPENKGLLFPVQLLLPISLFKPTLTKFISTCL